MPGGGGPEGERRGVVGGQAEHEIRVDQLALVPDPLVHVQPREGSAVRRAGRGERPGAVAVGDATVPVRVRAAVPEGAYQPDEHRMHNGAVIALVVVFQNDFIVRAYVVGQGPADDERVERVAADAFGDRAEARAQPGAAAGG